VTYAESSSCTFVTVEARTVPRIYYPRHYYEIAVQSRCESAGSSHCKTSIPQFIPRLGDPTYAASAQGSKRKLREGVWELRIALGRDPASGKYRRLSKTFRGSAREADVALRSLIQEQAPSVDGLGATFGQLVDQWLEECERLDLSPTTMRTYRSQLDQTIRPSLGKIDMRSLSPKQLDDLYGAMKTAGKSPKTIRNHHAIISAALHQGSGGGGSERMWLSGQSRHVFLIGGSVLPRSMKSVGLSRLPRKGISDSHAS
jgi:hypothetical protein